MYLCNFLIFSQIFSLTLQHITICCNGIDKRQLKKQHSIFEMSSHFASTFGLKWKLFYYNNTFIDRITLNQLAYQMKHSDFLAVNFNSHPNVIKLLNSSVLTLHVVPIFNLAMAKKLIDSEHSLVMSKKDIVETVGNTPINNFLIQVPKNWTNKMIVNTFDKSFLRLNSMTFVFRYETNYTIVIYEMINGLNQKRLQTHCITLLYKINQPGRFKWTFVPLWKNGRSQGYAPLDSSIHHLK